MNAPLCTHCGASITKASNINAMWMIACEHCHTPHYINTAKMTSRERVQPQIKLPRRLTINQKPDGVEIHYREAQLWIISAYVLGSIIFGLVFILFSSLEGGEFSIAGIPVTPTAVVKSLWNSLFFIVGCLMLIGFGYTALSEFVNRTTILLLPKGIEILKGPFPSLELSKKINNLLYRIQNGAAPKQMVSSWVGKRVIDVGELEQVYCSSHVVFEINDKPIHVYDVWLKQKNNADTVLIRGLDTNEQAHFIEGQIKHLYQIEATL